MRQIQELMQGDMVPKKKKKTFKLMVVLGSVLNHHMILSYWYSYLSV